MLFDGAGLFVGFVEFVQGLTCICCVCLFVGGLKLSDVIMGSCLKESSGHSRL